MFEEIRICGLGSIGEAVLELHPGLTVLSGETGAGKSSVVRAFGLLAGGRADAGQIRSGRSSAAVEARLLVDPHGPVARQVAEVGGELDGTSLIVARTLTSDGRSRAFVGGRSVPVGVLAELVGGVLALHGQSSQLQLRHPAAQRAALDRFAGPPVLQPLAAFQAARQRWLAAHREQRQLEAQEAERAREAELLRLGLVEVERMDPREGEDAELDVELVRLGAADELRRASEVAHARLAGAGELDGADDGGAMGAMALAARLLDASAANDAALELLAGRLHEVLVLTGELAADLASYAAAVDDDPRRLAAAQERRAELARLCRPHGTDVDGVLRWAAEAAQRLAVLDAGSDRIAELAAAQQQSAQEMVAVAAQLSRARRSAARALQRKVTSELAALSMTGARLQVEVSSLGMDGPPETAAPGLGADGADEVELLFAPGDGVPARPLGRCASGGELSRVVLALEVVLAAGLGPTSMVFDEVDAGIGGEAALEVGRRLAFLGRSRQVVCVTHLPQVAAFADRHLLVAKSGRGSAVRSGVSVLDAPERVRELSRMLAGVSDSELARGHAAELLASAAATTGPPDEAPAPTSPAGNGRAPRRGAAGRGAARRPRVLADVL